MKITECNAKQILDSRGNPTIEVVLKSAKHKATASVPSGKSAGSKEAFEKRDADGKGVKSAIAGISEIIAPALLKKDFENPEEVDKLMLELDGTPNKENLGANAILAVSIATTKLFAMEANIHLWKYIAYINKTTPKAPRLYMNVMNGGVHADFCLPFQEYIVVAGGESMHDMYRNASDIFTKLGTILERETNQPVPLGDEGGYAVSLEGVARPFEILATLVSDDTHTSIAIDAAASEFYRDGVYEFSGELYAQDTLLNLYGDLVGEYGLRSIEDPFAEGDMEGFQDIVAEIGDRALIVADDLTVTNPGIIEEMAQKKAANAIIIKPNQIGTLSQTYKAVKLARDAGWRIIVSHRSGETKDSFIADLAYGLGAFGIKVGAPTQEERVVKYERLLEIEEEINNQSH
ncbi:MAG TPA: phosphopyruvate hydratase [Candidatus Yonathbacteria bacterium]|nr:phosphopyruvate hydratase [Candidatus Yonathbacteria bacterium]